MLSWGKTLGSACATGFCFLLPCLAPAACSAANSALFISQKVPTEMIAGGTYYIEVTFRNTGDTTWTKAAFHRLGSQNPQDNLTWFGWTNRVELKDSDSIAPGQDATFGFNVYGPATPGAVDFQWRMMQEAVEWFPGADAATPNVAVTVHPRLEAHHAAYQAGETPSYSVSGAPAGAAILWSAWKNGVQTQDNADLGHVTDAGGNWTGTGPAWAAVDAGFWVKQVSIGGHLGRITFSVNASLSAAASSAAGQALSASHAAGDYRLTPEPFLIEGAKFVRGLNPNAIFIYLTPGYQTVYPATDFGAGPIASLKALAQTQPYQQLFSMGFSTFVITAHSFANEPWINTHPRGALGAGRYASEKAEFYDLAKYLLQTYQGTGRTFILKNWEGDWLMDENYELHYHPDATQIQAFRDWFNARHEGVVQARTELSALAGVRVLTAAEFTLVEKARFERPCWLADVLSGANADLLSYSSWQTISSTPTVNLRRKILEDIAFIRSHPSAQGRDVIISEFGFKETMFADSGPRTDIASRAFLDAAVPLAFYWEILDNECQNDQPNPPGVCPGLGLIRKDGTYAPAWTALTGILGVLNNAVFVSQSVPLSMQPSQAYPVTVTMRNTGNRIWDAANGFKLASQNPANNIAWGSNRVAMVAAEEVLPGAERSWTFNVTAPAAAGAYDFQWRMTQEGFAAFGDASTNVQVLVATPTSSAVDASAGGTLSFVSPTGTALARIPSQAFSEPVTVTLKSPASFPAGASSDATLQGLGVGLEVSLSKPLQPSRSVILTVPYRDSDAAGKDESRFLVARYDDAGGAWVPLPSTADPAGNTVTAVTRHFSVFQIMVSDPADTLSRVKVIPNPFRPSQGHTAMGFFNLPSFARLRVYTQAGELVKDLTANAAGLASWDGTNMSGKKAASGVYQVLAQGARGSRTLSVAVQR